jgi:NAD(P)-dependent dehydrogenase (short-subunit alcohol dehydrogenase family)
MQSETVVVLGGTKGIGLAVARKAAARGAHVIVAARGSDGLATLKAELPAIETHSVDATDAGALEAFCASLGKVDHLYNAAGAFVGGTLLGGDLSTFRGVFEARIWGTAIAIRALGSKIPAGGSIVLTGGLSTDRPVAGAWATAMATAAAEQMARALALELAPVRVNAVAPGWTDTPMWDAILGASKPTYFAEVAAKLPVGRLAHADEVADAVLFLMNNRAITGEVVHVDGGHRLV